MDKSMIVDIVRILLLPLVPFYSLIMFVRNKLFDYGIFKSQPVSVPVISVGNLSVGGSGKTPLVLYLASLLKERGLVPGVLSRGFGRSTHGYVLVSNGTAVFCTPDEAGDEIYQTAVECSVPAAVCERRVPGAKRFLKDTPLDTIILDDAFQHRWIKRDLDILLFAQKALLEKNKLRRLLLPTGNMREYLSSAKRASMIIINRKFFEKLPIPESVMKFFAGIPVHYAYYRTLGVIDMKKNLFFPVDIFKDQKALALCGIAQPASFFHALEQIEINTTNRLIFEDHKAYLPEDIQSIRKTFYSANAHSVITTQKDAVKLSAFAKELDDIDIYYLKIEMRFDDPAAFAKKVFSAIQLKNVDDLLSFKEQRIALCNK